MTPFLFFTTVLIWGTTWYALALQVGDVPVLTSVFYRFVLAAVVMMGWLVVTGRIRRPRWHEQRFFMAMGICLFSMNFVCFYVAAQDISSGLLSVIFSLATVFNAINGRVWFGDKIPGRAILASALGVVGLICVFSRDFQGAGIGANTLGGVVWAMAGTMFFSIGNMVSRRNSTAGISPLTANGWGMVYGAIWLGFLVWITGAGLAVPPSVPYVAALLYLAVFGSVVAFATYLMLVARIGSAQAAYSTVIFPVVALIVSTLFEGYQWHFWGIVGVGLTLAGNLVMFAGRRL